MKRSLSIISFVVVLALIGLFLLTMDQSAGSEPATAASVSLAASSTPLIAVTLTFSEYLTLTAGDVWSAPTPIHTPVIPTERPFLPKPTHPTSPPRPTPTLLPDPGVWMSEPVEIFANPAPRIAKEGLGRLVYPDLDGHTLVGVVDNEDNVAVVTINLENRQARVLVEESRAAIYSPRISERYVVWSTSWRDGDRGILHIHTLQTGQTSHIAERVYDFDVSGDTVVWSQVGDGWDIRGYDLVQQKTFPVVARPNSQTGSLISERWVVYRDATDRSEAGVGLYATDLDTEETIRLGQVNSPQTYIPQLYALDVPWVAWSSGHWSTRPELYLYNLSTRTPYTVTVDTCAIDEEQRRLEDLALSGSTLVFVCGQRMGYDIEHGVFFSLPIYGPEVAQGSFAGWTISGDRLVWILTEDAFGSQEQSHIYTAQIERDP